MDGILIKDESIFIKNREKVSDLNLSSKLLEETESSIVFLAFLLCVLLNVRLQTLKISSVMIIESIISHELYI